MESDTVIIVLLHQPTRKWIFHKSFIVNRIPESLFGLALYHDPEVKEITINEPVVTPYIMRLVNVIVDEQGNLKNLLDMLDSPNLRSNAIWHQCIF